VALQLAQDDLDAAIRTLSDFANEPAAGTRLRELRDVRDAARERVERLGAADDGTLLLLGGDWEHLSIEDQRRCIRATLDCVNVKPAESGRSPHERVEVVYHDLRDRLARKTPPLPMDLT
jgi:tRNA splicing endonuclease